MLLEPAEYSGGGGGAELENKFVGRAMRTTPRRETRDAYWADLGKGSLRNSQQP